MTIIKTPDDFFRDATLFNPVGNTYLISYRHFIDYFNKVSTITFHEMTIGINFTYGWMPTIFDYRSDNYNKAIEILNRVKIGIVPSNEDPNIDELIILRNLFNNSIVGASKLMHFINPDIIPIWDSRVCEYLTGSKAYYQIDNITANQYLFGKNPDFPNEANPLNPGLGDFGSNYSVLCKAHYEPADKFGITKERL